MGRGVGVIVAAELRPSRGGDSEQVHLYLLIHALDDTFVTYVMGGKHNPNDLLGEMVTFSKSRDRIVHSQIRGSDRLNMFLSDRLEGTPSRKYLDKRQSLERQRRVR